MNDNKLAMFYAALAKAQGELANPPKKHKAIIRSKGGQGYEYAYADLSDVLTTIKPVLAKHGLGHYHTINQEADRQVLATYVFHVDGGFVVSHIALPRGVAYQELGSAITYARRYSICALLGLAAESDTDAADVGPGQSDRDAMLEVIIEAMSQESIGNKTLFDLCGIKASGRNPTLDELTDAQLRTICETWPDIVARHKTPTPKPAVSSPDTADGLDPDLAKLMEADGITPEMLEKYYTEAGHVPPGTTPANLPKKYVQTLTKATNWAKALKKMKG